MVKKIAISLLLCLSGLLSAQDTYYVSTTGNNSNAGTIAQPFLTISYGIAQLTAGDTLFIRGGVYNVTSGIGIGVSGTGWNNMINIWAYPADYEAGNPPIVDASGYLIPTNTNYSVISASNRQYVHIKGITIRNFYQRRGPDPPGTYNYPMPQGFGMDGCANFIFENTVTHDISGRGTWYFSGAWNEWDGWVGGTYYPPIFPSDTTRFINCDAYNLIDSLSLNPGNAADGWKVGGYLGNVIIFEGCRAWNYSDDGIDPSGPSTRIFNNCWLMSTMKYASFGIEGNGIKTAAMWDSQLDYIDEDFHYVQVTNCIAAYCGGYGFINNLEPGTLKVQNNALYRNNLSIGSYGGFADFVQAGSPYGEWTGPRTTEYYNNISMESFSYDSGNPTLIPLYEVAIYFPNTYTLATNSWIIKGGSFDWPGWEDNPAYDIDADDFTVGLDSATIMAQLTAARKPDGSLPDITIFRLANDSELNEAGTYVGLSATPDVGIDWAYYDDGAPPITEVTSIDVYGTGNATTISTNDGTLQMLADISPPDATYQTVTWSRTNGTGTASINSSGLLTALTNGTVTVRATAVDGSGVYGEEVITISNQTEPTPSTSRFIQIGGKFVKSIRGNFIIK